jgi:hypothetical protein
MPTYEDLMELANICERRAQAAADPDVATVLSKMAMEYRMEAARIENGNFLDVGKSATSP